MLLKIFVTFLIVLGFLKSLFYGIYEIKQNHHKGAGSTVIILSVISIILPIVVIYIY